MKSYEGRGIHVRSLFEDRLVSSYIVSGVICSKELGIQKLDGEIRIVVLLIDNILGNIGIACGSADFSKFRGICTDTNINICHIETDISTDHLISTADKRPVLENDLTALNAACSENGFISM